MKKIERMKLGELKMNPSNPRTISEGQLKKLIVSLLVFPKMLEIRPIVVDSECQVLGGNQRLKALEEIAEASDEELDKWLQESSEYKAKSAEEQVAIFNHWQEWREEPRAYVIKASDLSEEEVQAFIIKDNVPFGEWDWELLEADWDLPMLEEWGLTRETLEDVEEQARMTATERLSELEFTGMYYEPQEVPNLKLEECIDDEKFGEKIKVIEESQLSDEQKQVMKWFAYRFLKINFEAVANYYAFCATEEEKRVMERLRMVLVDGGIEGFIEDDLIRVRGEVMATDDSWMEGGVSGYEG